MSWKGVDEDILDMFAEASGARGHTRRAGNQAAAPVRTFEFGELQTARFGLRTSKKTKSAEAKELAAYYNQKWRREAKGDAQRWATHQASRKAWRASPEGKEKSKATRRAYVRRSSRQIVGTRKCTVCGKTFALSRQREIQKKDRVCSMRCRAHARKNIRLVTIGGRSMPLVRWAEEHGLSLGTVWARVKRGWASGRAVSTPKRCWPLRRTEAA